MKIEVMAISYRAELTIEQMLELLAYDDKLLSEFPSETLERRLAGIGAVDVEYDGHFGAAVYFTLYADSEAIMLAEKVIETFLKHAHLYKLKGE